MDQTAVLTNLVSQAMKIAAAFKARAEKAKPTDPAALEKAAQAMADSNWITAGQLDQAKEALADPNQTLRTLAEMSTKSAEIIAELRAELKRVTGQDPRLSAGSAIPTKAAAAPADDYVGMRPVSEADRVWSAKMMSYRQQLTDSPA